MKPSLFALFLLSWLSLQPLEAKRESWHASKLRQCMEENLRSISTMEPVAIS